MRNLLSLVGFVVVVFLGLGWYLGWYQFAIAKGSNGNTQISFDVNTEKIKDDASKGASRIGDMVDGMKKEPAGEKKDVTGSSLSGETTPVTTKSQPTHR